MIVNLPERGLYASEEEWASAFTQALTDLMRDVTVVPAGAIVARETVPQGWYYCDGTNGTPDLTADELPGLKWIQKT